MKQDRLQNARMRFCYGSLAGNQILTGGMWSERSEANFGQASANFGQASV